MFRPTGIVSPDQVPTWLYQAVHLTGTVRKLSEQELGPHLDALSAKFENWLAPKPPWTSSKITAGRLQALKKAIVGLVMTVEEVEGSFKLNQTQIRGRLCGGCLDAAAAARRSRADDRKADGRAAAALGLQRHRRLPVHQRIEGTRHDPLRHQAAERPTLTTASANRPTVFVDGAAGTTGLGIRERLGSAERRRAQEHCRGKAQGCAGQARADGGGGPRHPLLAG